MLKLAKYLWILVLSLCLFYAGVLIADKQVLHDDLIRLHVVANSDNAEDQQVKLFVKDAVNQHLNQQMQGLSSAQEAKAYLYNHLEEIEQIASDTVILHGAHNPVKVKLMKEPFERRDYDTFSLPSGVYESLQITIGDGKGKNWWCVVFPSLCTPITTEGFVSVAVDNTIDKDLANTLSRKEGYEIRFFLLEIMGKIENFFRIH